MAWLDNMFIVDGLLFKKSTTLIQDVGTIINYQTYLKFEIFIKAIELIPTAR